MLSLDGGSLPVFGGVELSATGSLRTYRGPIDMLVVAGGPLAVEASEDAELVAAAQWAAAKAERVVSLCTGAFLLAAAGLLDGKRVTTHWFFGEELAARYPKVTVDTDPIYVRDGNVWTSAGITAALDLLLASASRPSSTAAASARGPARTYRPHALTALHTRDGASRTRGSARPSPDARRILMSTQNVAGIAIPDSALAQRAAALLAETSPVFLADHARRSFVFAALLGDSLQVAYDPELLYVCTILHDLGLTDRFATGERLEVSPALGRPRTSLEKQV